MLLYVTLFNLNQSGRRQQRNRTGRDRIGFSHHRTAGQITNRIDGNKVDYVEFPEFMSRMQVVMAQPDKAPLLSSLVAYSQSPNQQEVVMNQPSVHFTMQVLYRLGFAWNHTSSKYVDMIFEMLRTLQYFG